MTTLDLRDDAAEIRDLLVEAVRQFAVRQRTAKTARKHPPVTRIDFTFSLGDSESIPWVHLSFDTKTGGAPDGNPTHPDFAKLPRPGWLPAMQTVCEGETVKVTRVKGRVRTCDGEVLDEVIGTFLVDALVAARHDGVFADLILAARCELGVEDPTTGEFGWPNYEDRGKENLLSRAGEGAKSPNKKFGTIDDYIDACVPAVQPVLRKIRATIQKAAPDALERISYRMPAFFQDGALVYFGAFKEHIGFYPPVRDEALQVAAARFAGEKGNLKFPLDKPIPYALITSLVKARLKENQARKAAKKNRT